MLEKKPRLAIDIETVSPNFEYWETPDFRNSNDFEILAVAFAYQYDANADIQSEVLFRNGWGSESELAILEAVASRLESTAWRSYLTYNGDAFDFPHLRGRARIAAQEVDTDGTLAERLDVVFSAEESDDLKHDVWATFGDYTTLEAACAHVGVVQETPHWQDYAHGLDADEIRDEDDKGTPTLLSSDLAQFGERYLNWCNDEKGNEERIAALEELLQTYATADVVPLFELADARPYV